MPTAATITQDDTTMATRAGIAVSPRDLSARAPFRSALGERRAETSLRGEVPAWLRGDLIRTAPATFAQGRWETHHWFDALGLLYAFRIEDSGISYRQQPMSQTQAARAVASGHMPLASFAGPIERGFWTRLFQPIPRSTDNTNVHVLPFGDDIVALTETPSQWVVDKNTLVLKKTVVYEDDLGEVAMIAHPHLDFEAERIVSLATRFGPKNEILVYEHALRQRSRRVVGRIGPARVPYLHAFGLTPRHAIVIGHPFDVNPLSVLWSNRGFIDHFRYRPEAGTTLWLVERTTGVVREHTAPAGFVFHVVNAFEDGDSTSIDVALYPDASVVRALSTDAIAQGGLPTLTPSIVRWTMQPGRESATHEVLLDKGFEFPSIAYRRVNGKRHSVAWGARVTERGTASELVRIQSDDAHERTFTESGFVFGEPIFVARPGAEAEDDGVILSVGSHALDTRSAVVVLDARTLDVQAWAEVPVSIPLGFHGSFFR